MTIVLAGELDGRAGGARGREQAQLADREGPLGENLAHDGADLAGGADDGDGESGIGDAGHDERPQGAGMETPESTGAV